MTARAFGFRFSLSYALLVIGSGIQLPFLPLWLGARGLSVPQISAVVAALMLVRVIGAPLFATIADYSGNRTLVVRGCAIGAFVAYGALSLMTTYPLIMGVGMAAALLFAPVFPLIEGFSVDSASRLGLDYGRLRLWASLSFLAGSVVSGAMLTLLPAGATMYLITAAQGVTVLATYILPPEPPHAPNPRHTSALDLGDALKFLFASRFTVFLLAASLANCSHGVLYSISALHWTTLGFNTFDIGVLWAAAIIGEVTLFFFSNRVLRSVGVERMLCIGLFGATMRWAGMSVATNFYVIFALQLLHAISFATAHLSLMHFIRLHVPPKLRNTAQGLYTAIAGGLMLSSVSYVSGPLYARFGGLTFLFTAGLAALGLGVALYNLVKLSPRVRFAAAT
ncbi:MAG: MFS transporter [Alphaproteobacteria bacterium]|nr:MFS transporter [Alphaproteobacteria bacterium]